MTIALLHTALHFIYFISPFLPYTTMFVNEVLFWGHILIAQFERIWKKCGLISFVRKAFSFFYEYRCKFPNFDLFLNKKTQDKIIFRQKIEDFLKKHRAIHEALMRKIVQKYLYASWKYFIRNPKLRNHANYNLLKSNIFLYSYGSIR